MKFISVCSVHLLKIKLRLGPTFKKNISAPPNACLNIPIFAGKVSPKSEKYARITKQAGEVFGMGESPLVLRDDKKAQVTPRSVESELSARVATVGVNYKTSAEHLIPTLLRWRVAPPTRMSTSSDPRRQVNFHRYLIDCSSGQFKSTKLKYKEYTIDAPSF